MALVSVSEAADRLGVNVPRIHQRIADGSLRARRIGAQWVVDERSLLEVAERRRAGRPLSVRSAWAVIAASEGDDFALSSLAPAERSRAAMRLRSLLDRGNVRVVDEEAARDISIVLRSMFRNRAERRLFRAAPTDLEDLRVDQRWQAVIDAAASGIASSDVEGYLAVADVESLIKDYLLVPADDEANVVVHVVPDGQDPYPSSRLRLAADLAEHRGPREEARAAGLLHELAQGRSDR
ncbi:helix-turn-helix domain-containing protein [Nocardioides sp. LHD-245]|uniref:helix-turn-helix domain-containing protein n=1 Tax=Nocardioides sp. LHD-245 TaxID=3051387 RepID=UPI0027E0DF39|nr:helix-turn-helix domain-containing protein [Nocardioides sp. LHD-245]